MTGPQWSSTRPGRRLPEDRSEAPADSSSDTNSLIVIGNIGCRNRCANSHVVNGSCSQSESQGILPSEGADAHTHGKLAADVRDVPDGERHSVVLLVDGVSCGRSHGLVIQMLNLADIARLANLIRLCPLRNQSTSNSNGQPKDPCDRSEPMHLHIPPP